ncbi:MAG: type II toxin-antitoxin system VapB family antitoxin [Rhodospirillaceae bacterium]|nr:type II toxin-antitoxin system VapB family antitoxin [Rhodospirillaceae bacterium]
MALSIKDPKTDRLAREVARRTGETLTAAIARALEERLSRLKVRNRQRGLYDELDEVARACAALPDRHRRTDDDILGYDSQGIPHQPGEG